MKIDVKKVAKLSNLTLSPEEEIEFEDQLSNVLGYIEKLNAVPTTDIAPTAQITGLTNRLREDNAKDVCLPQSDVLSQAASQAKSMFKVPKLVDTTE